MINPFLSIVHSESAVLTLQLHCLQYRSIIWLCKTFSSKNGTPFPKFHCLQRLEADARQSLSRRTLVKPLYEVLITGTGNASSAETVCASIVCKQDRASNAWCKLPAQWKISKSNMGKRRSL